jgi:hypothetical protein
MNVYGFANGDPVLFWDPFGLTVCFTGARRGELINAAEAAIGARIPVDENGCTSTPVQPPGKWVSVLFNRFNDLVRSRKVWTLTFDISPCMNTGSHWCPDDNTAHILWSDIGRRFPADYLTCSWTGGLFGKVTENLPSIIAHEFLGHGWAFATQRADPYSEKFARAAENIYRRRNHMGERCN